MSKTDLKKKSRTIFIGDIHGCFDELNQLLKELEYKPISDRLISLGDLVHKGPKSSEVLDFFISGNLEVIMGNHDYRFLNALTGKDENYPLADKIVEVSTYSKKEIIRWLKKLPLYIEDDNFLAVHGAFNPETINLCDTSSKEMMNGRYFHSTKAKVVSKMTPDNAMFLTPWYKKLKENHPDLKKTIIFGHWAKTEPVVYKNFRGLDTGCCYGGHLTAFILEEETLFQMRSHQPRQFDY